MSETDNTLKPSLMSLLRSLLSFRRRFLQTWRCYAALVARPRSP